MSQLIRKARESTEGSRLTVHDYWNPSASHTRTQDAVVNEARHLILSAARRSSWRTAKPSGNATRIKFKPGVWLFHRTSDKAQSKLNWGIDFCFVLSKEPPTISFSAQDTTFLKTWGDPATEDEIYRISELESFIGTNLEYLLEGSKKDDASPRNQDPTTTGPKRRRLNIGSLYSVIPQVCKHFFSWRFWYDNAIFSLTCTHSLFFPLKLPTPSCPSFGESPSSYLHTPKSLCPMTPAWPGLFPFAVYFRGMIALPLLFWMIWMIYSRQRNGISALHGLGNLSYSSGTFWSTCESRGLWVPWGSHSTSREAVSLSDIHRLIIEQLSSLPQSSHRTPQLPQTDLAPR